MRRAWRRREARRARGRRRLAFMVGGGFIKQEVAPRGDEDKVARAFQRDGEDRSFGIYGVFLHARGVSSALG